MTTRERHPVGRDYQSMVHALAQLAHHRDQELAAAERAFHDSAARAADELARADRESAACRRRAAAAATAVIDVDREAARLWERLNRTRRLPTRSLGELPDPSPVEALPRIAIDSASRQRLHPARAQLVKVAARIDGGVRPPQRRPLPRRAVPLLPLVGVLVAAATGLVAAGLVTLGRADVPAAAMLRGAGWLAFLAAPSAGVPVAAQWARRVFNARLDIGAVGLTLLGGMIAATTLSLTFANR